MSTIAQPTPDVSAVPVPQVLPGRRDDLVVRSVAGNQFVIKDPVTDAYFQLGEQEWFLLSQLDGRRTHADVLQQFDEQYHEQLTVDDLDGFLEIATKRNLLHDPSGKTSASKVYVDSEDVGWDDLDRTAATNPHAKPAQSILFWRKSLFDPDALFNRVEPQIRWVWSPEFFLGSCILVGAAGVELWSHRSEFIAAFPNALRWESLVAVWFTLVIATICHEFAHGLTCKHHGGEVHEVGFLLMFFTPCLYCNVSDAWLIPNKWHRLWVTLAGAWCDLIIWALATYLWRLTVPDSLVNYLASVVVSVCGTRVFINFNPLLKLDGYYLLSDWLEIPNLRGHGWERWLGWLRCVLWGAPRPKPRQGGTTLLVYGMVSWCFSLGFLTVVFVKVGGMATSKGGLWGGLIAIFLGALTVKRLFKGFSNGEAYKMITTRPVRTALWVTSLCVIPLALWLYRLDDRVGGTFQLRTGKRLEVRTEVAGFLKRIEVEEGQQVSSGTRIGQIEVPDLESMIAQKTAAVQEAQANLRRLKAGPRAEEVQEQRAKVDRAREWRDLALTDLNRARQGYQDELRRYDQMISQQKTEWEYSRNSLVQSERLMKKGVLAGEQLRSEKKKVLIAENLWQQAIAQKKTREAAGVQSFESELARREKELKDTEADLSLMVAGARPEDIDAENARLTKFQEELDYYRDMVAKQDLVTTIDGMLTTPRLKEREGQFMERGTVICMIEDLKTLEAEIPIPEDKMDGIRIGQMIELKARAFPMKTFQGRVDRIAPVAMTSALHSPTAQQATVTVYCRVENPGNELRSGMSGYGRVYTTRKSLAVVLGMNLVRYIRTEFWW